MPTPVSVFDAAEYICEKFRSSDPKLTAMKLQKLLYYSQAWALVWNEEPLFHEDIQAWAHGPVIKELYDRHQGMLYVDAGFGGNSANLDEIQKDTIDRVVATLGDKTAQWLSDLTHLEAPWQQAREGLSHNERGSAVISLASIHEFYSSLEDDQD